MNSRCQNRRSHAGHVARAEKVVKEEPGDAGAPATAASARAGPRDRVQSSTFKWRKSGRTAGLRRQSDVFVYVHYSFRIHENPLKP